MEIIIPNKKLKRLLENDQESKRRFGSRMHKKLRIRMGTLEASESLADFWPPYRRPERCHTLTAKRSGEFSVDLIHPYRLLFRASDVALREPAKNELDRWQSITSIEILKIEDTHG